MYIYIYMYIYICIYIYRNESECNCLEVSLSLKAKSECRQTCFWNAVSRLVWSTSMSGCANQSNIPGMMATKEGASLLPTSSYSVKNVKADEGRFPIKRALFWLRMTTFTLNFCWLAFLTCRSFRPEPSSVLTADEMRQLMANQEVRIFQLWTDSSS